MSKLAKRPLASGPVRYEIVGPSDRPTGLMLAVNYEEAPVPQHYYVADWFNVTARDLDVIIAFGNIDHGERLRSKIEVVFPFFYFVKQLWRSSREFHGTLRDFVNTLRLQPIIGSVAELVGDKFQILKANNVVMILSGTETLLDFFYISPKDLWSKPRKGEPLELEGVVRVMLSPTLLLGFLDACEPIAIQLSERFKEHLREEEPNESLESQYAK